MPFDCIFSTLLSSLFALVDIVIDLIQSCDTTQRTRALIDRDFFFAHVTASALYPGCLPNILENSSSTSSLFRSGGQIHQDTRLSAYYHLGFLLIAGSHPHLFAYLLNHSSKMISAIPIPRRLRSRLGIAVIGVFFVIFVLSRHVLYTAWTLAYLPLAWSHNASSFIISQDLDNFDITFADYNTSQATAGPEYADRVPAVMHHVVLGSRPALPAWMETRQSCLNFHEGWETHYWTDEAAAAFVADKFPHIKAVWDSYPFLIQKVDALRYMVLYEYGGVVLDMDLRCKRALGPLRRFGFVAIEAVPVGFSSGFMMAERHNPLVGAIVDSLPDYNRRWLGLPYPTVMFSTGCHFAS